MSKTKQSTLRYEREERAMAQMSEAYHNHPSNPSSCSMYREHALHMGRNSSECPCEDGWVASLCAEEDAA